MEHVSNEEKAKEIAVINRINYYEDELGWGATVSSSEEECYDSALKMAEWKDEQLHEELLKLSFSSNLYDYMMWVCNKKNELDEQLKNKKYEQ